MVAASDNVMLSSDSKQQAQEGLGSQSRIFAPVHESGVSKFVLSAVVVLVAEKSVESEVMTRIQIMACQQFRTRRIGASCCAHATASGHELELWC
jgi:hypothetical protein